MKRKPKTKDQAGMLKSLYQSMYLSPSLLTSGTNKAWYP
jgi:hypothetical protein